MLQTPTRGRVRVRALLSTCAALILAVPLAAQEDTTAATVAMDTSRVYELAEVDEPPLAENPDELRAMLESGYPAALLANGRGGRVVVEMVVEADGSTRALRVASSTDSAFDAPSLAAVAVLRFAPGAVAGRAVATRAQIPIQWQAPARDTAAQGVVAEAPRVVDGERVYAMSPVVADGGRVYELREVDVEPRPRNLRDLRRALERTYPPALRNDRISGLVEVRMRVDRQGIPRDLVVTRTTDAAFNQPTLQSVTLLRFTPARVDGKAVEVWFDLPIQWQVIEYP